jgi:hypothetical protein
MSETQPLLGAVKKIRAIKDLVYLGRSIRGRRCTKIDGQKGAYDIVTTEGEEFECDQAFAKEAGFVMRVVPGNDITVRWLDTQGKWSDETFEPWRLSSMARINVSDDDKLVRVRITR